ncbi:MAG: hypothetical protein JW809_17120 [Pirellulales bacterium]|nr:hypothetical protein [Pirellulales bacterium]
MKRTFILSFLALAAVAVALADSAGAMERTVMGAIAYRRAQCQPWHGGYAHTGWCGPVALVVPPTAEKQTHWGWGVGSTRVTTIRHQYELGFPGEGHYPGGTFRPTPRWPSNTDQFGVYPVRGPW